MPGGQEATAERRMQGSIGTIAEAPDRLRPGATGVVERAGRVAETEAVALPAAGGVGAALPGTVAVAVLLVAGLLVPAGAEVDELPELDGTDVEDLPADPARLDGASPLSGMPEDSENAIRGASSA